MHKIGKIPTLSIRRWQILLLAVVVIVVITKSLVWIPFMVGFIRFKFPFSEQGDAPPNARCGAMCALCSSYQKGHCPSCELGDEQLRSSCFIHLCAAEKDCVCTECPEVLHCKTYRTYAHQCPFAHSAVLKDTTPHGHGFLVKENALHESLELFVDRIVRGDFGLVILRQAPDILYEWPPLENVPVLYLNQTFTQDHSLDPTNLAKLHLTIEEFLKAAPRATVLLEGMEYLIVHNGVDRILKFIHSIGECVKKHESRFITLVDPRILDKEEMLLLERELVPLKS